MWSVSSCLCESERCARVDTIVFIHFVNQCSPAVSPLCSYLKRSLGGARCCATDPHASPFDSHQRVKDSTNFCEVLSRRGAAQIDCFFSSVSRSDSQMQAHFQRGDNLHCSVVV